MIVLSFEALASLPSSQGKLESDEIRAQVRKFPFLRAKPFALSQARICSRFKSAIQSADALAGNRLIRKKASLGLAFFGFKAADLISHDVLWINVNVQLACFQAFFFRKLERLL